MFRRRRRRSRRPRGECQPLKPRGDRWAKPASSRPTDPPQGADAMIHKRKATFKPFLENLEDRRCPSYTILDLGTLGGTASLAADVNESSQVVGLATTVLDIAAHAFLWQSGTMTDLGTLGGQRSGASALNNSAQVVGGAATAAIDASGNAIFHAFLWQSGVMQDLGTLGGPDSGAGDINSTGQVVGESDTGAVDARGFQIRHAFVWQNGVMTDLNNQLPANSGWVLEGVGGINDNGQIAGGGLHNGQGRAFLLSGAAVTDLGTLSGGGGSQARDLNGSGQVVGFSTTDTSRWQHAFLYSGGVMSDLGTVAGGPSSLSDARAINGSAQIVGVSSWAKWTGPLGSTPLHAILWQSGAKTDLNKLLPKNSPWELTGAEGINNAGAIVGSGLINNHTHAYLLTSGSPLTAASTGSTVGGSPLTQAQVSPLLDVAMARWAAAGADTSSLGDIHIQISNLGGTTLGLASGTTIYLDTNAAGWGWFVDATPWDDSEFTTPG